MIETLDTGRLIGERLRPEHLAEFSKLHSDPRVMATLGGVRSEERTRERFQLDLEHWERHGYGLWAFRDQADGAFVGRAGLRQVEVEGRNEVEVAYALRAEYWGRGLATEMARALVRIAFEELGLAEVVAFTLPHNAASRRVMEKAGFQYEREIMHAGLEHVLYRKVRQWHRLQPVGGLNPSGAATA